MFFLSAPFNVKFISDVCFCFCFIRQENSISLVKAYWNELFTLGLAQCWQVMNVATILATFVNCLHSSLQQDKMSAERRKSLMEHIFKLQEFCNSMVKLCIDGHEYAYLKAIVLFSPGCPDYFSDCRPCGWWTPPSLRNCSSKVSLATYGSTVSSHTF